MDINGLNADNRTPLARAVYNWNVNVVRLLITWGAEVDLRDKWGWTPLHSASQEGHLEVSQMLVDHGANVNARDSDNWTPLYLSARDKHLGIVKLLPVSIVAEFPGEFGQLAAGEGQMAGEQDFDPLPILQVLDL